MIEKFYRFTCSDCKRVQAEYTNKDEAKARGWAIARGGEKCYCPACAFKHRNTGCNGAKVQTVTQLCMDEVKDSA